MSIGQAQSRSQQPCGIFIISIKYSSRIFTHTGWGFAFLKDTISSAKAACLPASAGQNVESRLKPTVPKCKQASLLAPDYEPNKVKARTLEPVLTVFKEFFSRDFPRFAFVLRASFFVNCVCRLLSTILH